MRKLDQLLNTDEYIDYPEDIRKIKEIIPELRKYSDGQVQQFYKEFSDDVYCAGWMIIDQAECAYRFARWLGCYYEEVEEGVEHRSDEETDQELIKDQNFVSFLKKNGFKR